MTASCKDPEKKYNFLDAEKLLTDSSEIMIIKRKVYSTKEKFSTLKYHNFLEKKEFFLFLKKFLKI